MRFLYQLCGIIAAAVFMLGVAVASPVIVVPDATYNLSVGVGSCLGDPICGNAFNSSAVAHTPTTIQAPCSAAAGAPSCAGASLDVAAGPIISVTGTTTLNHTQVNGGGDANVGYYYEVVCPTCAAGTIVPMSIAGSMEAHYTKGIVPANGTVGITDLDRAFVAGYNPVTSKDNVLVDFALEGLGAFATDLTKNPNPLTGAPPNGFGFCESTWTGFYTCNGGPSSPFGVPFYAVVNEPYNIFLDVDASIGAYNQPFATDYAEANMDPVLSFGPGFDSTGYSIALSSGIGNGAATVPEPATWTPLSIAALAFLSSLLLRRKTSGSRVE